MPFIFKLLAGNINWFGGTSSGEDVRPWKFCPYERDAVVSDKQRPVRDIPSVTGCALIFIVFLTRCPALRTGGTGHFACCAAADRARGCRAGCRRYCSLISWRIARRTSRSQTMYKHPWWVLLEVQSDLSTRRRMYSPSWLDATEMI